MKGRLGSTSNTWKYISKCHTRRSLKRTGRKSIGIRWLDVKIPNGRYLSRLVAKEFNDGMGETMHAALPALGEFYKASSKIRRARATESHDGESRWR